MPLESGNQPIKDAALGAVMQRAAERWKPAAMYFTTFVGQRTAFKEIDLPEASGNLPPPLGDLSCCAPRARQAPRGRRGRLTTATHNFDEGPAPPSLRGRSRRLSSDF